MPSTGESSTVTTPPVPTVYSALATTSPIVSSSLAEIDATRRKSSSVRIGCATAARGSTSRATARSMPRLTSTGLPPFPIAAMPCLTIASASTIAVVVPSPTVSLVLIAASLTSCAPMFSNGSRRWISRAMVTPSLVTSGEPVIRSRMTLRPLGPSVLFTEAASCSTPACSRCRASAPNRSSLAMGVLRWTGGGGRAGVQRGGGRPGPAGGGAPPPGGPAGPGGAVGRRPARMHRPAAGGAGSARLQGLEVEAEVLGGVLRVGEHDRAVVLVDHAAVVGGHALLEVGGAERPLLLAERLGQFVVDEIHPVVGVDADHRGQVGHPDAVVLLHDLGDHVPDLVVHQGDAAQVGRRLVHRAESGAGRGGHWFSSLGASRPRSERIPANRCLAWSSESSKRGGRASGCDHSGCSVRAAPRQRGTQCDSQSCMSCRLWSANSRSCTSGPKQACVQRRSRCA